MSDRSACSDCSSERGFRLVRTSPTGDGSDIVDDHCEACPISSDLGSVLGFAVATGSADEFVSTSVEGSCFGGEVMTEGIWEWTAPTTGTFCFDLSDSDYDTSLAIFDEGCRGELACDEDSGPAYTSYTSADLTEGQLISIVIDAYGSFSEGTYSLDISMGDCDGGPPPDADADADLGPPDADTGLGPPDEG